ncbi:MULTISPECIES: type II toxin-antitoxin system VapC family toxin [Prauserella salsuginis group]|uniref:Ribonuclease VapC n=2 Tax=Prauserella salsuginis group TaxID=2893672 RepID=A0A839XR09_9PSEU|nr:MULTISPECIES: type II toxin-antitoxin system VapC family toxin [Prauserella salsuginis group]MBB3662345.1 putative nucleic acid-binding protein [Prauserella sediminis]MCR3720057.1 putative nucleic acid-binding protein, contains PIN domain [Prauserella flava]MCR3736399.1 putative nucleic acid-binding protein, contains PIN domain [Prauserella salsuginis]
MTASEYVVDASALVAALTRKDGVGAALRKLLADSRVHAPYLIDAEVGQALRALERRGEITGDEALTGLRALRGLVDDRYDQVVLLEQTWSLRHTITFYDGLYVVLASALDMPLLTGDIRLSSAPGLNCKVELLR